MCVKDMSWIDLSAPKAGSTVKQVNENEESEREREKI